MSDEKKPITLSSKKKKAAPTMVKEPDQPAAAPEIKETPKGNLPVKIEDAKVKCLEGKRIVDMITIEDQDRENARALAADFSFKDTNAVLTFGAGPQKAYLETLKALLGDNKIKDIGGAGNIILELEKGINMMGIEKMKKELQKGPGFFTKIFGGILPSIKAFIAKRQDLFDLIEKIEEDTDKEMHTLMLDNARLDEMLEAVEANFYELGVWICAGEYALENGFNEFTALRLAAIESGDPVQISKANMFREQLVAMDTRLLRMKGSYVKAPVTMQKILTTQQASRIEVQTLMDSLLYDLPSLVETINMLISLYKIKGAQENREKREAMQQRLQELEGTMLDEVATKAKEGQAKGIKEVEMIQAMADQVLSTCSKMKDMDEQQAQMRVQAESTLVDVMENFKDKMEEITEPGEIKK